MITESKRKKFTKRATAEVFRKIGILTKKPWFRVVLSAPDISSGGCGEDWKTRWRSTPNKARAEALAWADGEQIHITDWKGMD